MAVHRITAFFIIICISETLFFLLYFHQPKPSLMISVLILWGMPRVHLCLPATPLKPTGHQESPISCSVKHPWLWGVFGTQHSPCFKVHRQKELFYWCLQPDENDPWVSTKRGRGGSYLTEQTVTIYSSPNLFSYLWLQWPAVGLSAALSRGASVKNQNEIV